LVTGNGECLNAGRRWILLGASRCIDFDTKPRSAAASIRCHTVGMCLRNPLRRSLPPILAPFLWIAGMLPCSQVSAGDETSLHLFRVLPLGNHPPFRQEERDGARYEVDPPEGSVPPAKVEVLTGGESGVEAAGKLLPFRLRLGSASPFRSIRIGGKRSVGLAGEGGEEWARLPLAAGERTLVVAWRKPEGTWARPAFLPLPDGPGAVATGSVRFVNVSQATVGLQWGGEKIGLNPGTVLVRAFPDGAARAVLTVFHSKPGGKLGQVYSNVVDRDPGKMHQFFIHQTDIEGIRVPVRVVPLIEDRRALAMPVEEVVKSST
jgi:hypothetical protein